MKEEKVNHLKLRADPHLSNSSDMRIGIVTTWFERGCLCLQQIRDSLLQDGNDVFIFAREAKSTQK